MKKHWSRTDASGPQKFLRDAEQREALRLSAGTVEARAVAQVSAEALVSNFKVLRDLAEGQAVLPMVKADAYGHGAAWAARHLAGESGLYGFGVATLEEGALLRTALGARKRRTRIVVFSDTSPWNESRGLFCEQYGLVPVIASETDWQQFLRGGWAGRIPYELMFNTGMNRLGIPVANLRQVLTGLRNRPSESHPEGVFSHLAMAESPDARLTRAQITQFLEIRSVLGDALPGTQFHLANSAGLWNQRQLGLKGVTDVVRPGISLYGVPPWPGAPVRGLLPVLTFRAQVAGVHRLKPGDSIGYGGTFQVSHSEGAEPVYAAILSAGYADGVKRTLSPGGSVWLEGSARRFLGVISMDLCAVECTSRTRAGDWAELLGPKIDIWTQARAAGTIPYELLTSISARVQRSYEPHA